MNKNKNQKKEEALVDEILKKIKKGEVSLESKEEEPENMPSIPLPARQLKEMRKRKEESLAENQKNNIHDSDQKVQDFIENMREAEEKVFDEMMEAVGAETEYQRVRNLAVYLKKNKKNIPERLIVNLDFFPYLKKYFLLAEAELRASRVNSRKLTKGYSKFLPKREKTEKKKKGLKTKKKLEKKIAKKYYVDVSSPTEEEKQAIQNLLKISEEFKKLYKEYLKLK